MTVRTSAKLRSIASRSALALLACGGVAVVWATGARTPALDERSGLVASVIPQATAETLPRGPSGFADVVDNVKSAVIGVRAKVTDASGQEPGELFSAPREFGKNDDTPGMPGMPSIQRPRRVLTSLGSGFFISADGYAVTNNHVVEGSDTVEIQTDDQKTHTAKVVGRDSASDLALLKVDEKTPFSYVTLADKMPRVGDWILAIGNPFGLGGTVTAGIVSARERNIGTSFDQDLLQIDAPINKGDSGGPSFDLSGKVVGVNTMIVSPTGGSIGIAFAIPADTVRSVVEQLRTKGTVRRGWMGVQIQPVTADISDTLGLARVHGVIVAEAEPGSPSAKAGLASGDVIVTIDGEPSKDARDLSRKISGTLPGTAITLGVLRKNKETTIRVTLGERPSAKSPPPSPDRQSQRADASDLGLQLAPTSAVHGAKTPGVLVTDVDPDGRAADSGLEPGDVILDVAGNVTRTPEDVHGAFREAQNQGRRRVLVRLKSGDTTRFISVSIDPT